MWGKGIEMKLSVSIFLAIVSTVIAQGILEEACDFRTLTNVSIPAHEDKGYGVWEVPGGKMPSKWSLNVYLVGRLEMMEEDGMPYVRVTENGVGQGEASLMLGNAIVPGPGIRYRISGKIRGSSGYIGAYIYLKTGGYIVRRLLNVTRQSEWMAFNTILDTDIKDVSHIVLCLVAARLSKIEVGDMKIEKDKYQEQLAKSYVIANESMRLVFHGSGATTELIDLRNGNDMLGVTTTMFKAVSKSMGDLLPDYVTFDGEYIHVSFDEERRFMDLFIKTYPKYFTISLIRENLGDVSEVTFFNICLGLTERHGGLMNIAHKGDFCAFLFSCNDDTHASSAMGNGIDAYIQTKKENGGGMFFQGRAYREFRLLGAKVAFAALPSAEAEDCAENIEIEQGLPHFTRDGIWLRKHPARTASYMMAGRVTEENVEEVIDFAKGGFGCIEMTDGWYDSSPTYEPHKSTYPNGMKSLKAVADKIHAAGLLFGLHSMQGMIGWGGRLGMRDKHITPVADSRLLQKQFAILTKDLDDQATTIEVEGPLKDWPETDGDLYVNGEIVRYKSHTDNIFQNCERGFRGTNRQTCKAGQKIGLIVNCWPIWGGCIYAPDIDSTLFDEIVERQAYVLNETSADMVYFDAGEEWIPQPPKWRNTGRFVNALQARLHKPVFAGGNNLYTHNSWHSIVRGAPAFDPMYYGRDVYTMRFKGYIPVLHSYNMFTGDVGWYRAHVWSPSTNAATPDELELLCLKAAATSSPISVQVDYGQYYANKRMNEMLRYIRLCDKIKQERLLPQNICKELYDRKMRHALLPDGDSWKIVRQSYSGPFVLHADRTLVAPLGQTFENPYDAQSPILRIRALPSIAKHAAADNLVIADCTEGIPFKKLSTEGAIAVSSEKTPEGTAAIDLSFDNKSNERSQCCRFSYEFDKPISLLDKRPLCVWVKADGQGGVLNVQLNSTTARGSVRENYIVLDFTGWKCFILDRAEDERYFDYKWPYQAHAPLYRPYPYGEVTGVSLLLNDMPPKRDSHVLVGPVEALKEYNVSLKHPIVSVNGTDVTLPILLEANDYAEWHADGTINVFERNGGLIMSRKGPVPPQFAKGMNRVDLKADGGNGDARCELTCIFRGETIFTFKYKEPAEPEPTDYRMLRGDRDALRTMLGNMELMPVLPPSFVSIGETAFEKNFDFARYGADESAPAAIVLTHVVGDAPMTVGANVGESIMDFADPAAFAEGAENIYGKFVSGSGLLRDASGTHANGALASMEAAPKGRNINGKGVLFKSLNSAGGDWTSKGITFANGLDLSAYDRILLSLNGDGGGEKLRIQFWDENGKYIDWIQTIDFTGWRTLCLPLSDAMHGFDFKKVKCFIVLYNGLPIYNECSVALADMRGLHKGDNIPQVAGGEKQDMRLGNVKVEFNGSRIELPVNLRDKEHVLISPDGKCSVYDGAGKLVESFEVKTNLRIKGKGNHIKVEGVGSAASSIQVKVYSGRE